MADVNQPPAPTLIEALSFYAEEDNYFGQERGDVSAINEDLGARASKVLSALEGSSVTPSEEGGVGAGRSSPVFDRAHFEWAASVGKEARDKPPIDFSEYQHASQIVLALDQELRELRALIGSVSQQRTR